MQKGGLRSSVGSLLESQVLARTKCCLPTVTRLMYPMVLQVRTNMLKGTESNLRVLGLSWNPVEDTVVFEVTLNFSKKKKGIYTGPNVKKADLPQGLPLVLTRIVLSQVMMTLLVNCGLSSSVMVVTSAMVLQRTSDGV